MFVMKEAVRKMREREHEVISVHVFRDIRTLLQSALGVSRSWVK